MAEIKAGGWCMSLGGTLLKVTGERGLRSYQRTIELRGGIEFENLPARQKPQLQLQLQLRPPWTSTGLYLQAQLHMGYVMTYLKGEGTIARFAYFMLVGSSLLPNLSSAEYFRQS
jgi:hypothetical protein